MLLAHDVMALRGGGGRGFPKEVLGMLTQDCSHACSAFGRGIQGLGV